MMRRNLHQAEHAGDMREARRDRYDPAARAAQPVRQQRARGYRDDGPRHEDARALVDPDRRREIASAGGRARAALYGHTGEPHSEAFAPHPPANVQRTAAQTPAFSSTSGPERRRSAPRPTPASSRAGKSSVVAKPQIQQVHRFAGDAIAAARAALKAAAAARAAASRPARRKAARERAAKDRQP